MTLNPVAERGGSAERLSDLLVRTPSAIAEALSGLSGVLLQAGTATCWEGSASTLPLPIVADGWTVLPVQETTAGNGEIFLMLPKKDAASLLQSLLGDAEAMAPASFGDLHKSALSEALAQVVVRLQKTLAEDLHFAVTLQAGQQLEDDIVRLQNAPVVTVGFPLVPTQTGKGILFDSEPGRTPLEGPVYLVVARPVAETWKRRANQPGRAAPLPRSHFPQLDPQGPQPQQNLHLLLDIQLQMVAVLGKRTIQLKDLLQMGPGAVLELERLAGEPLELIVNGKLVGYGEVVVVEDKLGIRVREMVQAQERLRSVNL